MKYLFIVGCIAFTVIGQLLFKRAANELQGAPTALGFATNWSLILGLACAGIAAMSWLKALHHFPLSYAYPFMSLAFPLVIVLSMWLFREPVRGVQWAGLALVLLGLILASR